MNIGQASKASGVSERMIRHYEKIGLVPRALRRDSGYRDYSEADVNRLRFIANARDLGFPVEEIRTLLDLWDDRDRASSDVKALAERRAAELGRKAAALEVMRATAFCGGASADVAALVATAVIASPGRPVRRFVGG